MSGLSLGMSNLQSVALTVLQLLALERTDRHTDRHIQWQHYLRHSFRSAMVDINKKSELMLMRRATASV